MVKLIAYKKENGECISVYECRNVSEKEYNELLNQELSYKITQMAKDKTFLNEIKKLNERIEQLESEIKVLKGEDENEESN